MVPGVDAIIFSCAFCHRPSKDVGCLVTGPGPAVNICDTCTDALSQTQTQLGDCTFNNERQVQVHTDGSTAICGTCLRIAISSVAEFRAGRV
jgi:hypothetical protein